MEVADRALVQAELEVVVGAADEPLAAQHGQFGGELDTPVGMWYAIREPCVVSRSSGSSGSSRVRRLRQLRISDP